MLSIHPGSRVITFRTPLVQVPRPILANDVRRAFVANGLSLVDAHTFGTDIPYAGVGLEAGSPTTRKLFEQLLGPGWWSLDVPFRMWKENGKWKTSGVSTCAMVALGLLRRMQVDCEDILDGYMDDIGTGLGVAINFARLVGAWQEPVLGLRPCPGAIIQTIRPMHVAIALAWDGNHLITADGGQTGRRGLQACAMRSRPWRDDLKSVQLGDRQVSGWIVPDLLPFVTGAPESPAFIIVPKGWERPGRCALLGSA